MTKRVNEHNATESHIQGPKFINHWLAKMPLNIQTVSRLRYSMTFQSALHSEVMKNQPNTTRSRHQRLGPRDPRTRIIARRRRNRLREIGAGSGGGWSSSLSSHSSQRPSNIRNFDSLCKPVCLILQRSARWPQPSYWIVICSIVDRD